MEKKMVIVRELEKKVVAGKVGTNQIIKLHLKSLEKKYGGRVVRAVYAQTQEGLKWAAILRNGSMNVYSNVLPKADYCLPPKTIIEMFKRRIKSNYK